MGELGSNYFGKAFGLNVFMFVLILVSFGFVSACHVDECEGADYVFDVDIWVAGDGCYDSRVSDSVGVDVNEGYYYVYGKVERGRPGQCQESEEFYLDVNGVLGPVSVDDVESCAITSRLENLGLFGFDEGFNDIVMRSSAVCPPDVSPNSVAISKICLFEREDSFPEAEAFASPVSGFAPLEVSFDCDGVGGDGELEYFWDFGDGSFSFLKSPVHSYLDAGEFEAECKVVDEDGDEAFDSVVIDVEKRDLFPEVKVSASPVSGVFPLEVFFYCNGVGGDGDLEYLWDFGDGGSSSSRNAVHVYFEAGEFEAKCKVVDEDGDEAFGVVEIEVGKQNLKVVDLACFENVIEGHNQSCSVSVEGTFGDEVGGVDVEVFYSDGSSFGNCVTNSISGVCAVKDLQDEVGAFEVYAIASKDGYVSDDEGLKFDYNVLREEYRIVDLKVFNDSDFLNEDYDFFRGEDMFVSFAVEDSLGNDVDYDFVSSVTLVSSEAGGRVDLEEIGEVGGYYYYKLTPIPVSHDFLGESDVFSFVFDFENNEGGQAEVLMTIRNNLPVILDVEDFEVKERRSFDFDLSVYEDDVEDSGDDLRWEVVSFDDLLDVELVGKELFVSGVDDGFGEVVLRLFDLDEDYDEVVFEVEVLRRDSGSSDCRVNWECSLWSDCSNGVSTRSCFDTEECFDDDLNEPRPSEVRECGGFDYSGVLNNTVVLEREVGKKDVSPISWLIVGALIVLFLALVLLFVILRR